MNLYLSNNSGILEIVTGSMFSGKSEELIRRVRRAKYAKQKTVVFKHAIDKRFEDDDVNIISHGKDRIEAILASNTKEMDNYLEENPGIKVVGVDEAQFFGEEVVAFCEKYVKLGKRVIVAGLDMNFRGEPFHPMPQLMAMADYVDKFHAICTVCGNPAYVTQRIINGEPAFYDDPVVLVGAEESYEARCRRHHIVKYRDRKEKKLYFIVGTDVNVGKESVENKYLNDELEKQSYKTIKINNLTDILDVIKLRREIEESILENDILFIRVIGGILFPLKDEYNLLNLMTEFRKEAEVILVAENKKGILNHVYLTIDVLHRNNISTKEVIYIKKDIENIEKEENIIKVSNSLKIPFRYL
ncbi:MAG: thymidine kinase [Sebaldella sp.]|nr:thymidine kinase [Sebaldella sp.]